MKNIILERRSVRNYKEGIEITKEELLELINDAQRAPSALNLQPWRFVIGNTKEARMKMKQAMLGNHLQFDTSSAVILILNDKLAYTKGGDIFTTSHKLGLMPEDVMNRQIDFASKLRNADPTYYRATNFYDIGLVSMNIMLLARINGYETSIMRGYDPEKMLQIIEMDPKRYELVSVISIGSPKEPGFPSYRLPAEETTKFI